MISAQQGSASVTRRAASVPSWPRKVDAALNQYLAAHLFQHSTSPHSSPLVVIPKKSGVVRITANYKKLNRICTVSQLPTPRVDQVLDSSGEETVVFPLLFGFVVPTRLSGTRAQFLSPRFALPQVFTSGSSLTRAAVLRPADSPR